MNYILFGSEEFLINQRVKKMIKSFFDNEEPNIFRSDYLEVGVDECNSSLEEVGLGFFSKKVVILDNADFLSVDKERKKVEGYKLEKLINNLNANDEEILMIFITKKDSLLKRSEVVKLIEKIGKIYSFPAIKKNDFLSYIRKYFEMNGFEIDDIALKLISENVGTDLYLFSNEAKKLMLYSSDKVIDRKDVEDICSINISDNVFELSNAILSRNFEKIFKIYNDLIIRNIEPITLISFLCTNFIFYDEILFLAKSGRSNEEIASMLSANPYRVQISLKNLKNYNSNKIAKILNDLFKLDKDIKLGKVDRFFAFEMFLTSL